MIAMSIQNYLIQTSKLQMAASLEKKASTSLLNRYQQVIMVLIKYGFEDILSHPPFSRLVPSSERLIPFRNGKSVFKYTRYERIRMVCEELGTTFIKFAQIAANRPDVLPEELIEELTTFHSNAPMVPATKIKETLAKEFKFPLDKIFASIDYQPIASASMAQVHQAKLIGGKEVVLKIQRPGIAETIEQDIQILTKLAQIAENNFPQLAAFQPLELVKMFEKSIRKELRFSLELANTQRFEHQFRGNDKIYVPTVYPEFSTDRILVMEFIDGLKITNTQKLSKIGLTGKDLALIGINLYFEQVFVHGFFHADPHPGNIFIMPNGKVCFIDFGMMGIILDKDKELLADLLLAVHHRDVEGFKKALLKFAYDDTDINEKDLEYDIIEFFAEYPSTTLEEIDSTEVIAAMNSLFFEYKIKVPANLLLLLKALVIIEGVGLQLDPTYNIIDNIAPFAEGLFKVKFSPAKMGQRMFKTAADWTKLSLGLPEDLKEVMNKIKKGKLHIEFEHKGLDPFYKSMEVMANRLGFSILLAAMVLASSLIVLADIPPKIYGMSGLGFVGFVLSALLSFRLAYLIIQQRKG